MMSDRVVSALIYSLLIMHTILVIIVLAWVMGREGATLMDLYRSTLGGIGVIIAALVGDKGWAKYNAIKEQKVKAQTDGTLVA